MLPTYESFTLRLQARSKVWSNVSERGNLKNMLRSHRSTIHHLSQLCMAFSPARTHLEVSQAAAAPFSGCTPCASPNVFLQTGGVSRATKEALLQQRACVLWFTGLSGSGKTTVATAIEQLLAGRGVLTALLDGDNMRHGLCCDLGFSLENREENIRRTSEVARMFVECGVVTLACFISPYRRDRARARSRLEPGDFIEVYMKSPLDLCEERDPKGLYKLARQGKIKCFTGIDDPYEAPENPEITLDAVDACGRRSTPEEMAATVVAYLEQQGHISALPLNNAVPHGKRGMQALDRRAKQMLDTAEVL